MIILFPGDSLSVACGPGLSEVFADLPDSYSMARSNEFTWRAEILGEEGDDRDCSIVLRIEKGEKARAELAMGELPEIGAGQRLKVDIRRKVIYIFSRFLKCFI